MKRFVYDGALLDEQEEGCVFSFNATGDEDAVAYLRAAVGDRARVEDEYRRAGLKPPAGKVRAEFKRNGNTRWRKV